MAASLPYPLVGVSLMPEAQFARAAFPLFEAGEVEVVEWSFDTHWNGAAVPDWLEGLLQAYSEGGRLLGHGVSFSIFTADDERRPEHWLAQLAKECARLSYTHITEHFGFMLAGDFHRGAPLPMPRTAEVVRLGRERVRRLAETAGRPIGLENLAFAFGLEDVQGQGEFLEELLEPVNGFVLLDLHNVHCQAGNFGIDPEKLLRAYPLQRVRELHVSGGSWSEVGSEAAGRAVRRDTHDGPVPEEVFQLLGRALELCPGVRAVIHEHLGNELPDEAAQAQYRRDFQRTRQIVHDWRTHHHRPQPAV